MERSYTDHHQSVLCHSVHLSPTLCHLVSLGPQPCVDLCQYLPRMGICPQPSANLCTLLLSLAYSRTTLSLDLCYCVTMLLVPKEPLRKVPLAILAR